MKEREYEEIASKYMNAIYKVAINACKNKADAEDVVQNTFIKLWKQDKEFKDEEHVRKWLIRVAINECNSLFRTPWKKRVVSLDEVEGISFSTPEKTELFYALQKLNQKEREIVHLYYYEEYGIREISEIMEMSETAVQTRLYRARNKLREELKGGWQ